LAAKTASLELEVERRFDARCQEMRTTSGSYSLSEEQAASPRSSTARIPPASLAVPLRSTILRS
jgi:hypothetical protein